MTVDLNRLTKELRPIQLEAIRAILSERSMTAAARRVGISRVTLWRWLKQPIFKAAVQTGLKAQIDAIWSDIGQRKL